MANPENWRLKRFHEDLGESMVLDDQTFTIETKKKNNQDFLLIKWKDADNGAHHHDHELNGNTVKYHTDSDDYNLTGHFENLGGLKILVGHVRMHKNTKDYYASVTAVKA